MALAVFLTFVLSPAVTALQRRRLGRTPAVVLVVLSAALAARRRRLVGHAQVGGLLRDLPTHTENVMKKTRALQDVGQGSLGEDLDKMFQKVSGEWNDQPTGESATRDRRRVRPVTPGRRRRKGRPPWSSNLHSPPWLGHFSGLLQPIAESLGTLALAFVLVVFMLLKREDLRNRLIRLAGHGSLTDDHEGRRGGRPAHQPLPAHAGCSSTAPAA